MKVARSTYAVPALEKGLAVLERLAVSPVPQGLAELAASLGRGRNELFRMCACLEAHGYIARDDMSGKWSLTLKLFTLAHGHSPVERLLVAAAAPMREFAELGAEGCHLSVADHGRLLVVAQSLSSSKVRLSIEVGASFDLLDTASGRLLLAFATDEATRGARLEELAGWRAFSAAAQGRLLRRLGKIRAAGRSEAEGESLVGVRDLALPVIGPGGVVAALACSWLSGGGKDEHRLRTNLEKTAAQIGRGLGTLP